MLRTDNSKQRMCNDNDQSRKVDPLQIRTRFPAALQKVDQRCETELPDKVDKVACDKQKNVNEELQCK